MTWAPGLKVFNNLVSLLLTQEFSFAVCLALVFHPNPFVCQLTCELWSIIFQKSSETLITCHFALFFEELAALMQLANACYLTGEENMQIASQILTKSRNLSFFLASLLKVTLEQPNSVLMCCI